MISVIILLAGLLLRTGLIDRWPEPRTIIATSSRDSLVIDGNLNERAWQAAAWSDPFVDITGDSALHPRFSTRVALVWNTTHLFIAARLEEPHVWARLRQRDTVIFYDNDFEFFFDPDGDNHRYGEIEINALNTVWDLLLERPYRDGGPALDAWDLHGMRTGVWIDGTLNDPLDTDGGWSVEIAIPWDDIASLDARSMPPSPGTQWRINFSRVEWTVRDSSNIYVKAAPREDNWVWSPVGVVNMHMPERWGVLEFRDEGETGAVALDTAAEHVRRLLMAAYAVQKEFRKEHGRWPSMHELETRSGTALPQGSEVRSTNDATEIWMPYTTDDGDGQWAGVTSDGRLLWK